MNFRFDPRPATFSDFTSSVADLRTNDVKVFSTRAALRLLSDPLGLRLGGAGDEIYFSSGAHNNLRVTFGPVIRF